MPRRLLAGWSPALMPPWGSVMPLPRNSKPPFWGSTVSVCGGWLSDTIIKRTGSATLGRKLPILSGLLLASTIVIARSEQEFDEIAAGKLKWKKMIADFYKPFHKKVSTTEKVERSSVGRTRELGVDPKSGKTEQVAFCPGFARGLSFWRGYALFDPDRLSAQQEISGAQQIGVFQRMPAADSANTLAAV